MLEEGEDGHEHFVVPLKPPRGEFSYRFEQISNWWMMAHGFTWWMSRLENGHEATKMLDALQIMIIGHVWNDEAFRKLILTNPNAALEGDSGVKFPPMKAWEDTDSRIHLVLPKPPTGHKIRGEFDVMGSAHTCWWFLLTPRIYGPAKSVVTDLVS